MSNDNNKDWVVPYNPKVTETTQQNSSLQNCTTGKLFVINHLLKEVFRDKDGNVISKEEFMKYRDRIGHKYIQKTTLKGHTVSTIWDTEIPQLMYPVETGVWHLDGNDDCKCIEEMNCPMLELSEIDPFTRHFSNAKEATKYHNLLVAMLTYYEEQ
jgi:hypothetical protein